MTQLTSKQGSMLFKYTRLKFWEPERSPAPDIKQASEILEHCFAWFDCKKAGNESEARSHEAQAVRLIQAFFPDFEGPLHVPFYGRKKTARSEEHKTQSATGAPRQEQPSLPEREQEQEQEAATAPQEAPEIEAKKESRAPVETVTVETPAKDTLKSYIEAGLKNIWLYGPAGTGKTTICREIAEELDLPCTILSCCAGTSPAEFRGFQYPAPRASAIVAALSQPGIIVLDEFTSLEPDVAGVSNALLANNEIESTTGHVKRHEDCIIIATSNTVGTGADRLYNQNNQLDESTRDRFAGAFIKVDYSKEYEAANFAQEACAFVWQLRERIEANKLRKVASTRLLIAADKLIKAGVDNWKENLVSTWTPEERQACNV